ncbi:MAG TPA: LD-carboxypeptidase [Ignavibacteria bacterium]
MDTRRSFLLKSALLGSLLFAPHNIFPFNLRNNNKTIKPKALKKGDKVGLIAPASYIEEPEDLNIAIDIMRWLGFEPVVGKNVMKQYGYLAGKDSERADEINEMFSRKDVSGIFCMRGGYGTMRILPYIDYENIIKNPKVIIGYSDITALLQAIYVKTGLVCFHGPVALSTYSEYTLEYLRKAIFINKKIGEIKNPTTPPNKVETKNRIIKINGGKAEGILIGGNLSLLVSLIGTPYDIDYKNKILFIEEIGEEAYRVDRMLTQLWLSGKLEQLSGIIIGKITDYKSPNSKPAFSNTLSLEEVIRTRLETLKIPAVYGYMIGHIEDKITVPIGVKAILDVDNNIFIINENAVE